MSLVDTTPDNASQNDSDRLQPDRHWREKLVHDSYTYRQLAEELAVRLLPRFSQSGSSGKSTTWNEMIDGLKETLAANQGDTTSIPLPVFHAETGKLIDGAASVHAIVAFHKHAPSDQEFPVLMHMGTIQQAALDVMDADQRSSLRRTGLERRASLHALLDYLVDSKQAIPSARCLARVFHIQDAQVRLMCKQAQARLAASVADDPEAYRAAKEAVDRAFSAANQQELMQRLQAQAASPSTAPTTAAAATAAAAAATPCAAGDTTTGPTPPPTLSVIHGAGSQHGDIADVDMFEAEAQAEHAASAILKAIAAFQELDAELKAAGSGAFLKLSNETLKRLHEECHRIYNACGTHKGSRAV